MCVCVCAHALTSMRMRAVWTLILDKMNAFTIPENWLYVLIYLPHNHYPMISVHVL